MGALPSNGIVFFVWTQKYTSDMTFFICNQTNRVRLYRGKLAL